MRISTVLGVALAAAAIAIGGCTVKLDSASQAQVDQLLTSTEMSAEKADAAATKAAAAASSAAAAADRAAAAAQKADAIVSRVR